MIRGDDPQYVYRSDESCRIRTLSPLTAERELEFYEITLPPRRRAAQRPALHRHPRAPHRAARARCAVEVGDHSARLRSGDSVAYPADVAHAIVNRGDTEAVVYLIDSIP